MTSFKDQLHPGWRERLKDSLDFLDEIESKLQAEAYLPAHENVMKALSFDPAQARVLILGQDPYPSAIDAMGLAFSTVRKDGKLPASLKNIFRELVDDLDISHPTFRRPVPVVRSRGCSIKSNPYLCRRGKQFSQR